MERRSARVLSLAGLTGALLAVAAAAAARPSESLQRYVEILERYRDGGYREAVLELGGWEPRHAARAAEDLLEEWRESTGNDATFTRLAQAAVLLHAELSIATAELGDPVEHERRVLTIRRLLRFLHGRERSGAATGVPGAIPVRDLYLAVASVQLAVGAVPQTSVLLVEYFAAGLGRSVALRDDFELAEYPPEELGLAGPVQVDALIARHLARQERDGRLLLLAGCAQEALALLIRQSSLDRRDLRSREALRRAEGFFRAALEMEPESPEAQLRLGWVLVRRERFDEARPLLETVTRNAGSSARSYLGWLFLGRLLELSNEPREALEAFERAAALEPRAPAARLALARAHERESGYAAASELLQPFFVEAGARGSGPGPWARYSTGSEELGLRPLEQLRPRLR